VNAPDKKKIEQRFGRSVGTYDDAAIVQREMAEMLLDGITAGTARRDFSRILEIGSGSGLLSKKIAVRFDCRKLYLNDLVPACEALTAAVPKSEFLGGDIEELELPGELDLVIANAVFQWLRNPEQLIRRAAAALNAGGVFAFSVFGPENCREIGELTGGAARLTYGSAEDWKKRLEPSFDLFAAHEEEYQLIFDSPEAALAHLKQTGVTANSAKLRWTKGKLAAFCRNYRERFSRDGGVTLTYHPILFAGTKKSS
jgi:malonyl-CoA O-methyltransferase